MELIYSRNVHVYVCVGQAKRCHISFGTLMNIYLSRDSRSEDGRRHCESLEEGAGGTS